MRKRIKIEKVEGEEGVICVFVERVLGTGIGWGEEEELTDILRNLKMKKKRECVCGRNLIMIELSVSHYTIFIASPSCGVT